MATQNINSLADSFLSAIEAEKVAELSKTASVTHTPVMKTEMGATMQKIAASLREVASADITADDIRSFRERFHV